MSRSDAGFALAHRGPSIDGVERPYRRREAPRRRRPRLLGVLFSALAKPLLVIAAPVALVAWMLSSSLFALGAIEVSSSGSRIEPAWIERQLTPIHGTNVLRLSLADVENRLTGHPWIEGVEIAKRLPSGLEVRVMERRAAVLVRDAEEGLWYSDEDGLLIAAVPEPEIPDVALILVQGARLTARDKATVAPEVPAILGLIGELDRAQPAWAEELHSIRPLGDEDFELETDALPFPLRVQKGRIASRAARLAELLGEIESRYHQLAAVDLRFERRIVLKPGSPNGDSDRFSKGAPHGQAG